MPADEKDLNEKDDSRSRNSSAACSLRADDACFDVEGESGREVISRNMRRAKFVISDHTPVRANLGLRASTSSSSAGANRATAFVHERTGKTPRRHERDHLPATRSQGDPVKSARHFSYRRPSAVGGYVTRGILPSPLRTGRR